MGNEGTNNGGTYWDPASLVPRRLREAFRRGEGV